MSKVVGFSQKMKRAWLDAPLDQLTKTTDEAELRDFLDRALASDLPSGVSRAKAAGIALRVWSSVPKERVGLRDRAVSMLPSISGHERIWLHWGMSAIAYPFFRETAEVVGRLLALQEEFSLSQIHARMLAGWGDRTTTQEAVQKLLTTFVDWAVLQPAGAKGHFKGVRRMTASTVDLQSWLLEALLASNQAGEIEARQLLRLPEAFPFSITLGVGDLRKLDAFDIHRQGLDMDMVALKRVRSEELPLAMGKEKPARISDENPSLFETENGGVTPAKRS